MENNPVAAFVTTVPPDRTVRLPPDVPVGATVAVVLLPQTPAHDEDARRERFERTRAALRAAADRMTPVPSVDDETLDALIERARRA